MNDSTLKQLVKEISLFHIGDTAALEWIDGGVSQLGVVQIIQNKSDSCPPGVKVTFPTNEIFIYRNGNFESLSEISPLDIRRLLKQVIENNKQRMRAYLDKTCQVEQRKKSSERIICKFPEEFTKVSVPLSQLIGGREINTLEVFNFIKQCGDKADIHPMDVFEKFVNEEVSSYAMLFYGPQNSTPGFYNGNALSGYSFNFAGDNDEILLALNEQRKNSGQPSTRVYIAHDLGVVSAD